jgi:hypothetical protein
VVDLEKGQHFPAREGLLALEQGQGPVAAAGVEVEVEVVEVEVPLLNSNRHPES